MKRKTNIFYNEGVDSSFLTFSNYTEAMTGNFVSTNTKLYPSKFLCLMIPKLKNGGDTEKTTFIKQYLSGLYENKLAFIRDSILNEHKANQETGYTLESEISSLGYLLDTVMKYDSTSKIVYVGDISEQDFNGTYTDSICVIDTASYSDGTIETANDEQNKIYNYFDNDSLLKDKLYGWFYINETNGALEQHFVGYDFATTPLFDGTNEDGNYYSVNPIHNKITINKVVVDNVKELEFNIIIPLFDIINNDYKTDIKTIQELEYINADIYDETNPPYISNVPLGIWFSTTESVKLYRDVKKGYSQSWSLVIGSQFKPFPYMVEIPNEIERDSIANAYMTFAEILKNQNNITNMLTSINTSLTNISSRINKLEKTVNDCPYYGNNMDTLRQEMLDYQGKVNQKINEFEQLLDAQKLKWVNREG